MPVSFNFTTDGICTQELRELVGLIASELRDDAVFDALNSVRLDDE
jgi:hypothetical protein